MFKKLHLYDSNNNKCYCGLKYNELGNNNFFILHDHRQIKYKLNIETLIDCKNCKKVYNSIIKKYKKV
jgi:hypothetical protein